MGDQINVAVQSILSVFELYTLLRVYDRTAGAETVFRLLSPDSECVLRVTVVKHDGRGQSPHTLSTCFLGKKDRLSAFIFVRVRDGRGREGERCNQK